MADWVKVSELLLGPAPAAFRFVPKHRSSDKASADQPAVESQTHEVMNGDTITITARFRKFPTLADAFELHGKLLATAPVYKMAMTFVTNPDAFADALTGVYATDPQYGFTLKWVIKNYGLSKYDR